MKLSSAVTWRVDHMLLSHDNRENGGRMQEV